MGLQSQLHCLNDCIRKSAENRLSLIPDDVFVFHPNTSFARFAKKSDWTGVTISSTLTSIRNSCNQKCSNKDCLHHSFQPHSDCDIVNRRGLVFAAYFLNVPNFPLILIETHVSDSFLAYCRMSLNIISLWTAFSPIHLSSHSAIIYIKRLISVLHVSHIKKKIKIIYDCFFRSTIILTCLLSCTWQLRESADQYFGYPTVSKVLIQFEDPVSIPAATLCDKLTFKHFNSKSNAFIFDAFKKDSISFINHEVPAEKFMMNDHICITVNPKINSKTIGDPQDSELTTFRIRHLGKRLKYVKCLIHDAYTRIHGRYTSFTTITDPIYAQVVVCIHEVHEHITAARVLAVWRKTIGDPH